MTPGAARTPAIEVRGLVKRYGGRAVVDRLDLTVGRGELFALLGPNGAGKTTTVEILEGYRRPDDGDVRILGLDPGVERAELRARIGLMLQQGGIYPQARPREMLRLFAAFYRRPLPPDELLERVGMAGAADRSYKVLSGGEKQRLGLALALVGRPELAILDEPTAGMDPAAKAATRALIGELRRDGVTMLLTTHELADVEHLADRVGILSHGRLLAEGSPADLTAGGVPSIRFRLDRSLDERAIAELAASLSAVGGGQATLDVEPGPGGVPRHRVGGLAPTPALTAALATWCAVRGLQLVELRVGSGSLEERYLELVGPEGAE